MLQSLLQYRIVLHENMRFLSASQQLLISKGWEGVWSLALSLSGLDT